MPSHLYGVAVVTVGGRTFEAGDTSVPFAIESISKVFTAALVAQQQGVKVLPDKVGVDATGLPFNSVAAIEINRNGVGGGIIAVVPGRMGIATFAPPLDSAGNSVKGQLAVQYLSSALTLNLFASNARVGAAVSPDSAKLPGDHFCGSSSTVTFSIFPVNANGSS